MPEQRRVSHSLLDPLFFPLIGPLYRILPIPRRFPPEGIVVLGHLLAAAGAVSLALSLRHPGWAAAAALCVAGSHVADMVDGSHARATGQCRNGGELLDHFFDPLAFSYWVTGLAVSCGHLEWAIAGCIVICGTATLTSIRAKILGEFTMPPFGSTEVRTLLVIYGAVQAFLGSAVLALWTTGVLVTAGGVTLLVFLVLSVRQVNSSGPPPDTRPWEVE